MQLERTTSSSGPQADNDTVTDNISRAHKIRWNTRFRKEKHYNEFRGNIKKNTLHIHNVFSIFCVLSGAMDVKRKTYFAWFGRSNNGWPVWACLQLVKGGARIQSAQEIPWCQLVFVFIFLNKTNFFTKIIYLPRIISLHIDRQTSC